VRSARLGLSYGPSRKVKEYRNENLIGS
jgi:hypothetical protein